MVVKVYISGMSGNKEVMKQKYWFIFIFFLICIILFIKYFFLAYTRIYMTSFQNEEDSYNPYTSNTKIKIFPNYNDLIIIIKFDQKSSLSLYVSAYSAVFFVHDDDTLVTSLFRLIHIKWSIYSATLEQLEYCS